MVPSFLYKGLLDLVKGYPQLLSIASCLSILIITRCTGWRWTRLPGSWRLIGILPSLIANLHRVHDFISILLRETNGTIVFKGPGFLGAKMVLTCDPANVNHIVNLHLKNYPKGHHSAEIFDILGDGIITTDGELWKTHRNMANTVVMDRLFKSSVVSINKAKIEKSLVPFLDQMAKKGLAFDLQDVILRFTFDVTCTLVLGVDLGSLAPDMPTIPFANQFTKAEKVLLFRHLVPMFWWKLLRRLNIFQEKKMKKALEVADQFMETTLKNNSTAATTTTDATTTSILRSYIDRGYSRSHKFLRDSMLTLVGAGKDTTGATLSWFFWIVSKNPNVEANILQELKDKYKGPHTSYEELVYLHASLCETLRLYPSIPFMHRQSLDPDVLPSGHKILSRTKIIISIYSMGRMEGVWGGDCMEFNPERWISKGKLRHEPSYKFLAFSSGPRSCLGKDIALTQMKIVVAAIMSNFELQVVDGQKVEPGPSIFLCMKNGLKVR